MIDYYRTGIFRPELLPLTTDEPVDNILRRPKSNAGRKAGSTVDTAKVMPLYKQGLSDQEIQRIIGVGASTNARWRKENNLPSHFAKFAKKKTAQA
jgi:transposase